MCSLGLPRSGHLFGLLFCLNEEATQKDDPINRKLVKNNIF